MYKLMIVIDGPQSRKNGFVVLKVYYSKDLKINKYGRYVGNSIYEADIFNYIPIDNCDVNKIKEIFEKYCKQLSLNSFYIKLDYIKKFFSMLKEYEIVFIDNTDKKLFRVDEIKFNCENRREKYKYVLNSLNILYYSNNILVLQYNNEYKNSINEVIPIVKLMYYDNEKAYYLIFDYYGNKIALSDKKISIKCGKSIYLRNYQYEKSIVSKLISEHFVKLLKNKFSYSGHENIKKIIDKLSEFNIIVQRDENIITPEISVRKIEPGWFELDLNCEINGQIMDLASKIKLFSDKNEIREGDKTIILPESIINAKEHLIIDSGKIKINESHILNILQIIHESNKHIKDFFKYSDVSLELPSNITNKAFNYQLEGIKWLKFLFLNHLGGCLADDMGLGKTFQVISFLEDNQVKNSIYKVLIIVPKSLLLNWEKEFDKFKSTYKVGIYYGNNRNEFIFDNYNIVITTYNIAFLDKEVLNKEKFSILIFDEIQIIKNYKGEISNSLKQLNVPMKIGLSGTPMENNISELWNIMNVLNPKIFMDHSSFIKRYNKRNYSELKDLLDFFILRRMKKEVLKEIPNKTVEIIYCDMEQEQRKLYSSISLALKNTIMSMKIFSGSIVLKGLTLLRQCCCHPLLLDNKINVDNIYQSCKMDVLKNLISNLYNSGHKILVFSNYTSMLNIIKDELEHSYNGFIYYLDGKSKNRNKIVEKFEKSQNGIFLISIKAGGVGLNLVSAQDVVIVDPWWNPFVEEQAIDRAYRIGQENSVTVYKLVVANSIEERIIEMQNDKTEDFNKLLNGISKDKNIDLEVILNLL
ncbi:DEAD/DEAH box helicase [Clostridium sp. MSJ-8]|uniref:DEAD/DEAH box helicase n=1 Tax=Clostridium sp. MSJ-8 TaxID=2841510 RepID=UPI001C0EBB23|nr:DEAD/DEAH box helicase [Clostridium sp. MSJ-8]MBU5486742.1 DEAD/DEAH box helicase [Clostridium sp. MSJ-8]